MTPTSGLTTSESGTDAVFELVLDGPPLKPVFIPLRSSDPGEGVVTPTGLTFTPANWDVPQSVFVLGQDDSLDDGNIGYSIISDPAVSLDPSYIWLECCQCCPHQRRQ